MRFCVDCGISIDERGAKSTRCIECAEEHYKLNFKKYRKKQNINKRIREDVTNAICPTCHNPFIRSGRQKYCHIECSPHFIKREKLDELGPTRPAPKLYPCQECGNLSANRFLCPLCHEARCEEYSDLENY